MTCIVIIYMIFFECVDYQRAGLKARKEKIDIIVGDLADPIEGGPCYQLYTKSFYEQILKPKLDHRGIFVTRVTNEFLNHANTF